MVVESITPDRLSSYNDCPDLVSLPRCSGEDDAHEGYYLTPDKAAVEAERQAMMDEVAKAAEGADSSGQELRFSRRILGETVGANQTLARAARPGPKNTRLAAELSLPQDEMKKLEMFERRVVKARARTEAKRLDELKKRQRAAQRQARKNSTPARLTVKEPKIVSPRRRAESVVANHAGEDGKDAAGGVGEVHQPAAPEEAFLEIEQLSVGELKRRQKMALKKARKNSTPARLTVRGPKRFGEAGQEADAHQADEREDAKDEGDEVQEQAVFDDTDSESEEFTTQTEDSEFVDDVEISCFCIAGCGKFVDLSSQNCQRVGKRFKHKNCHLKCAVCDTGFEQGDRLVMKNSGLDVYHKACRAQVKAVAAPPDTSSVGGAVKLALEKEDEALLNRLRRSQTM